MKTDHLALLREGAPLTTRQQLSMKLQLSWPAIMAQLATIIMQYIDAAMVGRLGATQSAAVGLGHGAAGHRRHGAHRRAAVSFGPADDGNIDTGPGNHRFGYPCTAHRGLRRAHVRCVHRSRRRVPGHRQHTGPHTIQFGNHVGDSYPAGVAGRAPLGSARRMDGHVPGAVRPGHPLSDPAGG